MSNLHKNLLNDELHVPKDFQSALNNTKLTKDSNGDLIWAPDSSGGGGVVTSLTTTGTSGASTLASGVLNIPIYAGSLIKHYATTWRGCVTANTKSGANYIFRNPCDDSPFTHSLAINPNLQLGARDIINGSRINVTKTGANNFSINGKILASGNSASGILKLVRYRLVCDGEQPEIYLGDVIFQKAYPPLSTNGFFCIEYTDVFSGNQLVVGDLIVPVIEVDPGITSLSYTLTVELQH